MWRYPSQIFDASLPDNYKISARQRRAKWMASSHFSNAKRGNATQATTEFCIILFASTREIIAQQNRSRILRAASIHRSFFAGSRIIVTPRSSLSAPLSVRKRVCKTEAVGSKNEPEQLQSELRNGLWLRSEERRVGKG